ncbi:HlyC/CorC family transporter [Flaviflexus salsibiostraticola]|uniref:HlyC/CorC family transporter n=2 Tax=Flaviflexus salsibiostraticola TaxID=1282737 RepID=A0A3Q8WV39_9ACTO|nr:HlyC/CorC family transporter [Flaviflexus salsibiostraticola]
MIDEVPELPVILTITLLVLLSAVTVMADSALLRITRTEAAEAVGSGKKGAHRIASIVASKTAARAGLATLRTVADMMAGAGVALLLADVLGAWWQVVLVTLGAALVLSILLGFLSPRRIGYRHPVTTLRAVARPLSWLTTIFSPFVKRDDDEDGDDDLAVMVERMSESNELEDEERILLQSVFDMRDTMVREVMVPRTDMVTVHMDTDLDSAQSLFVRSGYSRIPVIGDTVDDVAGVLYSKDIVRRTHRRLDTDDITAKDVMREAVFIPEMKPVDDVLHDMQAKYFHMALVVDEYGGIAGLVTIEDLLEELVGEMVDEHDQAAPEVERLEDGVYRVPARLPIDELGDLFGLAIDDEDVDTAGGLLAKGLGQIPILGSETDILGLHLVAERFEGRRKRLATLIASLQQ